MEYIQKTRGIIQCEPGTCRRVLVHGECRKVGCNTERRGTRRPHRLGNRWPEQQACRKLEVQTAPSLRPPEARTSLSLDLPAAFSRLPNIQEERCTSGQKVRDGWTDRQKAVVAVTPPEATESLSLTSHFLAFPCASQTTNSVTSSLLSA